MENQIEMYMGKVAGIGKISLCAFESHTHMFELALKNSPTVKLYSKEMVEEGSGVKYAIDPSFHSGHLSADEWNTNTYVLSQKSMFQRCTDEKERKIAGPGWFPLLFTIADEYLSTVDKTEFVQGWLKSQQAYGYGAVRDCAVPNSIVETLVAHNFEGLEGFAVTTQYDNVEILANRPAGKKVYLKLFADGSFGGGTVNQSYETEANLNQGIRLLKEGRLDGVLCHGIGDEGIIRGLGWFSYISSKSEMKDIEYSIQHSEIVTPKVAARLREFSSELNGLRVSVQSNFWPFDLLHYKGHELMQDMSQVLPLRTIINAVGKDKVDLGTDGMPPSMVYLAASCLFHPCEQGRIGLEEFFEIMTQRKIAGKQAVFDTDAFAEAMNDLDKRREFLSKPYEEILNKVHNEVLKTD